MDREHLEPQKVDFFFSFLPLFERLRRLISRNLYFFCGILDTIAFPGRT